MSDDPRSWNIGAAPRLQVHDWGGAGDPVLLAHPTGFHGLVLRPIARGLVAAGRHVLSFDFRGHGASDRSPSTYDWSGFADDVLTVVDALGLAGDAALLPAGHSKGGAALLMAEAAAPGTFARVWCYEPIVIRDDPFRLGEDDRLVRSARRRRDRWDSADDARAAFASRPPLGALHPDALHAYVEHGFVPSDGGGVELRCRPDDEAEMYALRHAHKAWNVLPQVACPVRVACGGATDSMTPRLCERIVARLPDASLEIWPGRSHLGPLEDPAAAVASILAFA